jgi:FKBP-type peptidyl-prolyl cis-trans isomerase SlyD
MSQIVADEKVVLFHYVLTDDDGETIDSSRDDEPLAYLHGKGQIVSGLEKAMAGKKAGDTFQIDIAPADGYGEVEGPGPQAVERSAFPADTELEEGMMFNAEMPDGNLITLWVTEIQGDEVFVDQNHPLAGETLHFDVEIVEVRDATAEELAHGHAHGPGGHHHH